MTILARLVAMAALAISLSACASGNDDLYTRMPAMKGRSTVENTGQKPVQCVPYAREHSRVKLYGDAWTWWDKAKGKYPRGSAPQTGAVMVLHDYAGPEHGHVAVVRTQVSAREIRVDHANWLNDGSIFINNPVLDVSEGNDWSVVRVFNIQTGGWGSKVYPVKGFIGSRRDADDGEAPEENRARPDLVASNAFAPQQQIH